MEHVSDVLERFGLTQEQLLAQTNRKGTAMTVIQHTLRYGEDQSPVVRIEIQFKGDGNPDHEHDISGVKIVQASGVVQLVGMWEEE